MANDKPSVKLSPRRPLTHNEMIFDFVDFPVNDEFTVRITGPNPQPYWVTLKTDGFGQAQLIWRTQAGGDYKVEAKGDDVSLSESFTVHFQQGEEDLISRGIMEVDRDVKTVEDPDEPKGKAAKPKPRNKKEK